MKNITCHNGFILSERIGNETIIQIGNVPCPRNVDLRFPNNLPINPGFQFTPQPNYNPPVYNHQSIHLTPNPKNGLIFPVNNHNIPQVTNVPTIPPTINDHTFSYVLTENGFAIKTLINLAINNNSKGMGVNALGNLRVIDLSSGKCTAHNMLELNNGLIGYNLNLQVFHLSHNMIGDNGIDYLIKGSNGIKYLQEGGRELSGVMQGLFTQSNVSIVKLNLTNSGIGDIGADILSHALLTNSLPSLRALDLPHNNITDAGAKHLADSFGNRNNKLKALDVSNNQITQTGEGFLAKALKNPTVQNVIVLTQKLEQNSKLLPGIGTKEEKIFMYREYLKKGIEKGTNNQAIVVDTSFLGEIKHTKNQFKAAIIGIGGFIKCNWQPNDVIESYAQEKLTARVSKTLSSTLSKLNAFEGVVSCYLQAVDEMYISETGQQVLTHKLEVMGENEFSSDW